MARIVPAILEKDIKEFEKKLQLLKEITNYIQIDIIDNWPKADNTLSLKNLKQSKLLSNFDFEIHLMVKNPTNYLTNCQSLGASMVYAQIEHMKNQNEFLKKCQELKLKGGLALNLPTFLNKIKKESYYHMDAFLLMSVEAGKQGESFSKKVLGKLKRIVRIKKNLSLDFIINVDGGINAKTAKWCLANGANSLSVGSFLFKDKDLKNNWKDLDYS